MSTQLYHEISTYTIGVLQTPNVDLSQRVFMNYSRCNYSITFSMFIFVPTKQINRVAFSYGKILDSLGTYYCIVPFFHVLYGNERVHLNNDRLSPIIVLAGTASHARKNVKNDDVTRIIPGMKIVAK